MPLLSAHKGLLWIGLAVILSVSCSRHQNVQPTFTASGYIADGGVVRLWRNDEQTQQAVNILSVFSPFKGRDTVITRYQYLNDQVHQINRTQTGDHPETVQLRFDEKGNVSFMQRQRDQTREKLSDDELALYQFEANHMLEVSSTLRAGHVHLIQGQWRNGMMFDCQGKNIEPGFDQPTLSWMTSRSKHAAGPLGVAWLEAPEGTQLLLVANEDFCHWQPKSSDL